MDISRQAAVVVSEAADRFAERGAAVDNVVVLLQGGEAHELVGCGRETRDAAWLLELLLGSAAVIAGSMGFEFCVIPIPPQG